MHLRGVRWSSGVWLLLALLLASGCRGGPTAVGPSYPTADLATQTPAARWQEALRETDDAPPKPEPGTDEKHPLRTCGPIESYMAVQQFRCPDRSAPLASLPLQAARQARRGSRPETDGTVLDMYDLPCSGGAQVVFVNMYHCRPVFNEKFPFAWLTREQEQPDSPEAIAAERTQDVAWRLHREHRHREALALIGPSIERYALNAVQRPRAFIVMLAKAADIAIEAKDLERAQAFVKRGMALAAATGVTVASEEAELHFANARLLRRRGLPREAEVALGRSMSLIEAVGGAADQRLPTALLELAELQRMDQPWSALRTLRRALHLRQWRYGNASPWVVAVEKALADLYKFMGESARAEALRARAVALEEDPINSNVI